MRRQLIPCLWTRHSECTSAKVHGSGADHKVTTSGYDESLKQWTDNVNQWKREKYLYTWKRWQRMRHVTECLSAVARSQRGWFTNEWMNVMNAACRTVNAIMNIHKPTRNKFFELLCILLVCSCKRQLRISKYVRLSMRYSMSKQTQTSTEVIQMCGVRKHKLL